MLKRLFLATSAVIVLSVAFAPSAFATITMYQPLAGETYVNDVFVQWSTPSTRPPSSLTMTWTMTSGPYYNEDPNGQTIITLAGITGAVYHDSFSFSPGASSISQFASVYGFPLVDGTYSVHMTETEASSGAVYLSTTATNVTIDYDTVPASLTAPVDGSTSNTLPVAFDLPQLPGVAAGSVQLSLTNQSTNAVTTLDLPDTQDQSFTLSPGNLGGGSATVASGLSSLPDGTYSVVLSYGNSYGEAAASSTPVTWTLDTTTQTPQAPSMTGGTDGSPVQVSYDLPEAATPGTVQLVFTGSTATVVTLNDQTAGTHNVTLDPYDLTSSTDVASVFPTNATLPDGSDTVTLSYQDALGNPAATSATSGLTVSPLPAPSLTAPVAGSTGNTLPVSFDLPQAPGSAAGSVQLSLTNQATSAVTTLDLPSTQNQSFTLSPGNLGGGSSATVASGPSSLSDGTYSLVLSYTNAPSYPTASSTPLTWTLETTTQTPQAPTVTGGTDGSPIQVSYDLPEAATPGSVALVFTGSTTTIVSLNDHTAGSHTVTLDPSDPGSGSDVTSVSPANATLLDGSYTAALVYQDALGNPTATSATSGLTVSAVPSSTTTTSTATPTSTSATTQMPATARACSSPSGRLGWNGLGPLTLGMTRASARAALPQYVVTPKGFDRFCLLGGDAIRVAYASTNLLPWVPAAQRASLRGRIVLALTSNPFYALHSITPGATLASARTALHLSKPLQIGLNTWYFVPGKGVDGVLKVRDGVVDELGIATQAIAAAGVRARTMRHLWAATPK